MHVHIYCDEAGEWRWRVVSDNGRKLADSGEGYVNEADCREAVLRLWPVSFKVTGD
jgi:uncharacterized protein YegP (UPF0339 family)